MDITLTELRARFESETDIKLAPPSPADWQAYALWLENDVAQRLNREALAENEKLRAACYCASEILEGVGRG